MVREFIGRERELSSLEKRYKRNGLQFVAIYGRRRVGKTTLINEFRKDKRNIYYQTKEGSMADNLRGLSNAIWKCLELENMPEFKDLQTALSKIFSVARSEKLILILDEYPYLAGSYPAGSSIIQELIDQNQDSQMFVILCGSSMSFMENQIIGKKSPLYGRTTAILRVEPFGFFDSVKFIPDLSDEDKVAAYGMTGGTPRYLALLDDSLSIDENIAEIADVDSVMWEVVRNITNEEFREPSTYRSIMTAISNGHTHANEISIAAGIEPAASAVYLKKLASLGFIEKIYPVNNRSNKSVIYRISENVLHFWYDCVEPYADLIIANDMNAAVKSIHTKLNTMLGSVFEDICAEYIRTNTEYHKTGKWWGSDPVNKKQVKIDIIGIDTANRSSKGLFCECKYTSEPIGTDIARELMEESSLVHGFEIKEYALFSKSGFTKELISNTPEGMRLYELRTMLDEMK